LTFDPKCYGELEKRYKAAVQGGTRFSYQDSDWLETDLSLPAWYDYRQQIERELTASLAYRKELNNIYAGSLPIGFQLPEPYQNWRFNIRVKNKAKLISAIFKAGLFASSHYASLAGIMTDGHAPRAEKLAGEVINLFNDHHFDLQKAEQLCSVIMENYEG
jgi:hypothetical protein